MSETKAVTAQVGQIYAELKRLDGGSDRKFEIVEIKHLFAITKILGPLKPSEHMIEDGRKGAISVEFLGTDRYPLIQHADGTPMLHAGCDFSTVDAWAATQDEKQREDPALPVTTIGPALRAPCEVQTWLESLLSKGRFFGTGTSVQRYHIEHTSADEAITVKLRTSKGEYTIRAIHRSDLKPRGYLGLVSSAPECGGKTDLPFGPIDGDTWLRIMTSIVSAEALG